MWNEVYFQAPNKLKDHSYDLGMMLKAFEPMTRLTIRFARLFILHHAYLYVLI